MKNEDIRFCMRYYSCKRCPQNPECEAKFKKEEKAKRKERDERRKMKQGYYE